MVRICIVVLGFSLVGCTRAAKEISAPPTKALEIREENAQLLSNLGNYPNLESLRISCLEGLQVFPDSIGNLPRLKELIIDNGNGCAMNPVLPESIGNLTSLEKLVLYGAQDPGTPDHPDIQPSERHKFPAGMSRLKNLVYLDLGRNGLSEVPSFVKDLPKLQELGFAWNIELKEIPKFLTELRELTTLKLDSDGLTDLPDFLSTLPKLSRITLGNNRAITKNQSKMKQLRKRFPRISFDFEDEYDYP